MSTKQARNCRVGDILLFQGEESRVITNIVHKAEAWTLRTTDLAGESPRFDTYDALDKVNVRGTQEVLF